VYDGQKYWEVRETIRRMRMNGKMIVLLFTKQVALNQEWESLQVIVLNPNETRIAGYEGKREQMDDPNVLSLKIGECIVPCMPQVQAHSLLKRYQH